MSWGRGGAGIVSLLLWLLTAGVPNRIWLPVWWLTDSWVTFLCAGCAASNTRRGQTGDKGSFCVVSVWKVSSFSLLACGISLWAAAQIAPNLRTPVAWLRFLPSFKALPLALREHALWWKASSGRHYGNCHQWNGMGFPNVLLIYCSIAGEVRHAWGRTVKVSSLLCQVKTK